MYLLGLLERAFVDPNTSCRKDFGFASVVSAFFIVAIVTARTEFYRWETARAVFEDSVGEEAHFDLRGGLVIIRICVSG